MIASSLALRTLGASLVAIVAASLLTVACGERVSLGVEPPADGGAGGAHAPGDAPLASPVCEGRGCGAPCLLRCDRDGGDCPVAHCDPQGVCRVGPQDHCSGDAVICGKGECGQPCSPCNPKDPACEPSPAFLCDAFGACVFAVTDCPCVGPGCGVPGPREPCADRACGDPCHQCAPGSPDCLEPPGQKACDFGGACVRVVDAVCPPGLGPCTPKACGEPCGPCGIGAPGCSSGLPATCDLDAICRFAPPTCASPCDGASPGAPCTLCPAGRATCAETKSPKRCDAEGRCVPAP